MVRILIPVGKKSLFIRAFKEETVLIFGTVNSQHNRCTVPGNTAQFFQPTKLIILIKVCEHRDRVNKVESIRSVIDRRSLRAEAEGSKFEISFAPVNCLDVDIGTVELCMGSQILHVYQSATATAPEIENAFERSNIAPNVLKHRLNIVSASAADRDELFQIW